MRPVLLSLAVLLAAAAPADARPDTDYAIRIDLLASARAGEDGSLVQFALPRRARVSAGARRRTVSVAGTTTAGQLDATAVLRELRGRNPVTTDALVDRPLTAAERRYAGSALVWIDGDVLAVHPANPLCPGGATLADVRALLSGDRRGYAPAGLSGEPEPLFGLRSYGSAIRAVRESTALAAVGQDPDAVAAVAWSAAREPIASGAVCAVAIDGVAPTEATLRDRSYPAAVHMTYAYSRAAYRGFFGYASRWYRGFLRSAKVRTLLQSARGRARLLP